MVNKMNRTIIHVDMDAFYAAVEVRDNPALKGKPLIIGALPSERGVVSTCSYEARKYGVRSAMSIKEAYRRCPHGIYMHPNMGKYREASNEIHKIWAEYTDLVEYLSLDEGYLDVTGSLKLFGDYKKIGYEIKRKAVERVGLTCSVGVGYSMMSAKLASEEKKPNGYFEILSPEALKHLITDRDVRAILGVGIKTAEALKKIGIYKVRDIYNNERKVIELLGNHGRDIVALANGIDERKVETNAETKSIGKEHTFQKDITDLEYLKAVLRLIAKELSFEIHQQKIYCSTVTLKITYGDMRSITRSKTGEATNRATEIYETAAKLFDTIEKRPIRLIGISLSSLSQTATRQMSLFEDPVSDEQKEKMDGITYELQKRFGFNALKTGNELIAEKKAKKDID